ncbi:hypothetical protein VTK73DRAFT_7871 [Phialemonium thermophilum]|uniref:Secreted protein n=1 Tax=Phialemonium thermophilum TaxID=223376 RepID=A0ABR3WC43_9PEZI
MPSFAKYRQNAKPPALLVNLLCISIFHCLCSFHPATRVVRVGWIPHAHRFGVRKEKSVSESELRARRATRKIRRHGASDATARFGIQMCTPNDAAVYNYRGARTKS